jgi:hypothetical protein
VFLDTDLDPTLHNLTALSNLAEFILNAPASERAAIYVQECRRAAGEYGLAGNRGPERAKAQLTSWALL